MPERSAHPGGTLSGILNGFNPLDFAIYLGADFRQMYLDR
jgi:hypothetical protein